MKGGIKKEMEKKNIHGTTIACISNNTTESWLIASDTQATEGHRIMPDHYPKIYPVGNYTMIAGTGSVSDITNVLKKVLRWERLKKIQADEMDLDIPTAELGSAISEFLFDYNKEAYTNDICSNYIMVGYDTDLEKNMCYSISSDGALIQIQSFYSDGSGSDFCISQLQNLYDNNHTDKKTDLEMAEGLYSIICQTSKLDVFTNDNPDIFIITKEGKIKQFELKEEQPKEEVEEKSNGKQNKTG